ncbi:MAG: sigma-70 family RNA polymerase sigma factor [Gemmataceae bacterium]|nr:sigma-70 family RNA polymerase sigma factor [Gemmataceae bacterium]
MATEPMTCVLRHVRKLIGLPRDRDLTDDELLESFVVRHDESAFEALVQRHGPLVLRVCRRVLGNTHDAEDAFQAAFLVLARKAPTIRQRGSIAGWLYGVAYHLALRARSTSARRRAHESRTADMHSYQPADAPDGQEVHDLLDEELHRLPEKYRTPLVLCYLEGKTNEQAAREIGCPSGSMSSRLARAREVLRDRLSGRGVALSSVGLTALLTHGAAPNLSAALVDTTVRAAMLFAAGKTTAAASIAASAVTLAEGALSTMLTKIKLAAALVVALGLIGTGSRWFAQQGALAQAPAQAKPAEAPSADSKEAKADAFGDALPPGALARLGTLRWRHGAAVFFVSYSKDDKELITASHDGVIRVWDVETGKELRRCGKAVQQPGNGGIGGIGVAPAGKVAIQAMPFNGAVSNLTGAAISHDRKVLVTSSGDGTFTFWDLVAAKEIRNWKPNPQIYTSGMLFAPDGKSLFTKGNDPILRQFDVENGKEIRKFGQQPNNNNRVVFFGGNGSNTMGITPDGKTLYSGAMLFENNMVTGLIKRFDIESGKEGEPIKSGQNGFQSMALSADGKQVAWGANDGTIHVWDIEANKEKHTFGNAQNGYAASLVFSPDGKVLATRGYDQVVRLWDMTNGKELRQLGSAEVQNVNGIVIRSIGGGINNVAFSHDGKRLAAGTNGSTIRQWEVESGKEVAQTAGHHGTVATLGVSPDGKTVATRGGDNTVHIWDIAKGQEVRKFELPAGSTFAVFSADGQTMALSGNDGSIRTFDVKNGKEIKDWKAAGQGNNAGFGRVGASSVAISADGKKVAVRGTDWLIRVYEATTGKELRQMGEAPPPNPNGGIFFVGGGYSNPMVFSPDGTALATLGAGQQMFNGRAAAVPARPVGSIEVYDVSTGKLMRKIDTGARGATNLAFSPNGRSIATVNNDGTISLWEAASAKERFNFKTNTQPFVVLAYSPDGRTLIGAGHDQVVHCFSVRTGKELAQFRGHQGPISGLALATDGKTLVSGSSDTTALVWNVADVNKEEKPAPVELDANRTETLWKDLSADDAKVADAAIRALSAAPKSVTFLAERVKAVTPPNAEQVKQLILDLEGDKPFAVRQKATDELEKLGELAADALQKVLDEKPGLETQMRIERLLARLVNAAAPPPDLLRSLRALEVLEDLGTPEARQLVETIAKGAGGAQLTRQARETLNRMPK